MVISGFNFPRSKPARILDLIAAGEVSNFISESILAEAELILTAKFFWALPEVVAAAFWFKTFCHLVRHRTHLAVILDGPDNRILECAVTGEVAIIITGDKHLLVFKAYKGIEIVKPADFLVIMVNLR